MVDEKDRLTDVTRDVGVVTTSVEDILKKYGIDSDTEVSDLEKDDFSELEASCWYINFWVRIGAAMRHEKSNPYEQPTSV